MDLVEKINQSPEALREIQAERLVMEITELICEVMERESVTRTELAVRLGKSRAYITKLLNGNTSITVKTIADVFAALGRSVRVVDRPLSIYTPRLLVTETSSDPNLPTDDAARRTNQPNIKVGVATNGETHCNQD